MKYNRNVNGISFQMASMESAYRGETIMKPATRLFKEIVDLYRNNRNEYEILLKKDLRIFWDKNLYAFLKKILKKKE